MSQENNQTGKDQATGHDITTGPDEDPGQDPKQSEGATSGFTEAQLAELQELFTELAPSRRTGRLRGWFRRNSTRARIFVQEAAPPDEETEFDENTVTGWLAGRASKNRGVTAVLALVAILIIGGFWIMILAGGLSLPLVAVILVLLLSAALGLGLLFRRSRR